MAYVKVKLGKWKAPNFALVDGSDKASIPVADLPSDALDELARDWLDDLYAKAGKMNAWRMD